MKYLFYGCGAGFWATLCDDPTGCFNYLHKYKGLAFLIEFYDVEHLQSMDDTVDDLLVVCQKNGGVLL